jgi:nicotinamide riboside transporter PnuC
MILAENIVNAFIARKHAESWAAWANNNIVMSRVLAEAEVLSSDND